MAATLVRSLPPEPGTGTWVQSEQLPANPGKALARGCWVKWIGGAANQDLAAIEDLAGVYALAGVHCLDVAADAAVVAAARRGIAWAERRNAAAAGGGRPWRAPWLMVSLSDGVDPHFRKAWFDPGRCPPACPRPCERVCPALAIGVAATGSAGVLHERCYGCGRCLPACPLGLIEERPHVLAPEAVAPLLAQLRPDAVELHTRIGRGAAFAERLAQLRASGLELQRLAVSCGLEADSPAGSSGPTPEALAAELWDRFAQLRQAGFRPLWQLDGRPMSGDLGDGTAHAAVRLLEQLAPLAPPGPLQLAGGTNQHSLELVERLAHRRPRFGRGAAEGGVAGVAFGGVARRLLQPLLLEAQQRNGGLLEDPELTSRALALAEGLVRPWLCRGLAAAG
jgi:Fe-S-cluster-containing hydrogenase component 2